MKHAVSYIFSSINLIFFIFPVYFQVHQVFLLSITCIVCQEPLYLQTQLSLVAILCRKVAWGDFVGHLGYQQAARVDE